MAKDTSVSQNSGSSKAVSYKDAYTCGINTGLIVFVLTMIFTRGWQSFERFGLVLLYTAVTAIVVTGLAALMNYIVSKDKTVHDPDSPVMD